MTTVVLTREVARRFTAGATRFQFDDPALTVRSLLRALDERHPGLGAALRTDTAVAIDGAIYQDAAHVPIGLATEVCFLPAIEGG